MHLLAQRFLNKSLREDCSKFWATTLLRSKTGVAIKLRISTYNAFAKCMEQNYLFWIISMLWKSVKVRVSSSSLAESHSICSAAGAICVRETFTQSDGTLTIEDSSSRRCGGAGYLGAPPGGVSRCCLSRLWICGRFILVLVSRLHYIHPLAQKFLNKSFRKEVANNQIAALKKRWRTVQLSN